MVDYDKLYNTDMFNWTILSDTIKDKTYIIYAKTFNDWATFSFYKHHNKLNLNGVTIYCDTFDKANKLVRDVLKVNKSMKIHDRYKGRTFKIKKLLTINVESKY